MVIILVLMTKRQLDLPVESVWTTVFETIGNFCTMLFISVHSCFYKSFLDCLFCVSALADKLDNLQRRMLERNESRMHQPTRLSADLLSLERWLEEAEAILSTHQEALLLNINDLDIAIRRHRVKIFCSLRSLGFVIIKYFFASTSIWNRNFNS